jgi:alpha,alpha-trehalase
MTRSQHDILAHGVDKRGVPCQHYGTDALYASMLMTALFGFLPGNDGCLRASVLAIAEELTENDFVRRYRTGETDDGIAGREGPLLICSFWLVSSLAIIGEMRRAGDLMERLVKVASLFGSNAEEFDVDTRRHLGNFRQAFSYLALVEAASRIVPADSRRSPDGIGG